jgi:glycosyltransferase involved in cell wall biosynthesis
MIELPPERERPRITVVVPAFNLEDHITASLRSALAQTVAPDEILVVDDGSTDATREQVKAEIARDERGLLRLIETTHEGPGAARNRGIAEATGEWLAFLDGDDQWLPEKLATVHEAIAASPEATMIAHDTQMRLPDGRVIENLFYRHFEPAEPLFPQLYRTNFIPTSSVIVRTDALRRAGGFEERLGASQDYDLWLRLARDARLVFLKHPLGIYVRRPGSLSSQLLLRYTCVLDIAYRHAPALVPYVGRRRAVLLRLRLVLIAQHDVLSGRVAGNLVAIARVIVAAPYQLVRSLIAPIEAPRAA